MLSIRGEFASKAAAQRNRGFIQPKLASGEEHASGTSSPHPDHGESGGDNSARGAVIGGGWSGAHGLVAGSRYRCGI